MSNAPKLAKNASIGLGAIEFIGGLVFAAIILIQGMWLHADPKFSDPLWWPIALVVVLAAVFGPLLLAWIAKRSLKPSVVWICLAALLAYPASVIVFVSVYA